MYFLALATSPAVGMVYVVIGGFGIGATSPLQGIHASTIFPPDRLGQGMGTMTLVFGVAMALGPTAVALMPKGTPSVGSTERGRRRVPLAVAMMANTGARHLLTARHCRSTRPLVARAVEMHGSSSVGFR